MATHKTLGLEIGSYAVHAALCTVDEQKTQVDAIFSHRLQQDESSCALALQEIATSIFAQVQASGLLIGQVVDSTQTLTAHQMLQFNDPRVIEKVLPETMSEIWKKDDDNQLSFEVGEYVKSSSEEDAEGGYDVFVVSYSKESLKRSIELLKAQRLEPHLIVPELQALPAALSTVLNFPESPVALLDIGAQKATLSVIEGGKIVMTRAFKLGSQRVTEAISQAFEIAEEEAEELKTSSGFIAMPGQEEATYNAFVSNGLIMPNEAVDCRRLSQVCAQGMTMLFSGVNQSLMRYAATARKDPTMLYFTGSGSKLPGLVEWFSTNMGLPATRELPLVNASILPNGVTTQDDAFSLSAICAAISAANNAKSPCSLNLRRGDLAHKGSLEYLKDNCWVIASIVLLLIIAFVFMLVTKVKAVNAEHDQLKVALEKSTEEVFGKKIVKLKEIQNEVKKSAGYSFIPTKTAFDHYVWLSNEITNGMTGIDIEFEQIEINTVLSIVTFRGDVSGDDSLPQFIKLLESYECFEDDIPNPKTNKQKEKVSFSNFRVNASKCKSGGTASE